MKKYAVIVAGGSGLRMGTSVPRFLELQGKPVFVTAFLEAFPDLEIILVASSAFTTGLHIIQTTKDAERMDTEGGETRFHSVKKVGSCTTALHGFCMWRSLLLTQTDPSLLQSRNR
jgi:2-C-methyl-D-erythritol 4-phosphate cytidylyltransferase